MGLISTSIDLDRGVLTVKTSKCKEKLEINVKPDPQHHLREEINVHARRYVNDVRCPYWPYKEDELIYAIPPSSQKN